MIIWINGAFGSGKSSVAEAINKKIAQSFVYDPEQIGYFLWDVFPDEMKRKGNFQHIPIWREFNYKILKHISDNYDGIIIVPMTIYKREYYDEIISRLINAGVSVRLFILSVTRQTILNRLIQRGNDRDGWGAQHIDACLSAFETEIPGEIVVAEDRSIDEIADKIIQLGRVHIT